MLKLLLIIVITIYLLSRIGRFLFRFNPTSQGRQQYGPSHTDSKRNGKQPRNQKSSEIKGGEYVDFEEVK
ncbi:MAG: hypothetical protein RIB47_14105 [Cyclobacteriaceae bacterium]